jgi:septum formation protein
VSRHPELILASASPRRRELLGRLGLSFATVPAEVAEREEEDADPRELVLGNARLKAEWVAARRPGCWTLGADTTVFIDGVVLNKPADLADARRMLRLLSGKTHTVFTGLAVVPPSGGATVTEGVSSHVTFKSLDEIAIDRYFERVNPLDKAGAYAIQEAGELIIERLDGSLTNVIGLPLEETAALLTRCGLPVAFIS